MHLSARARRWMRDLVLQKVDPREIVHKYIILVVWHAAMKGSIRLTRSVFTATATVLQLWGELSVICREMLVLIYMEDSMTWLHTSISIIGWHMHNYHIMHKVFLACTIIGSTPSILGHFLCPSQHSPLPCTRGIPLHRQSQADKNIMGSMIMSADLIIDTKMVGWYVFQVIIPIRMMQLPREKGAQYMYHPPKHIILIMRNVCL